MLVDSLFITIPLEDTYTCWRPDWTAESLEEGWLLVSYVRAHSPKSSVTLPFLPSPRLSFKKPLAQDFSFTAAWIVEVKVRLLAFILAHD